ncbi:uncharacterized protein LOC134531258 [Bacillus rossius redtenbacheri]|uniref:uncharacterized protein LOC134531258 n=1 Tax=Bacillus rossius redtenbacheri TaxID=93214 RepID=UPI002FDE9505
MERPGASRTLIGCHALLAVCCLLPGASGDGCSLELRRLRRYQPLLLAWSGPEEGGRRLAVRRPSAPGEVRYSEGERALLACPGEGNCLLPAGGRWLEAVCRAGRLEPGPGDHSCRLPPAGSIIHADTPCADAADETARDEHTRVQIVFQFGEHRVSLVDVCFNTRTQSALYSKYEIAKEIDRRRIPENVTDVHWWEGTGLYSYDVAGAYSNQEKTLGGILGDEELARTYLSGVLPLSDQERVVDENSLRETCSDSAKNRSECYLVEGHLAGELDFVYLAQQFATLYYVNSAPQWRSIKGRNWERIGEAVRHYASSRRVDLEVYAGTHGVASLRGKRLYIHRPDDEHEKTPVPQWLWKLVVDRSGNCGVVFLVLNNPYMTSEQAARARLNCSSAGDSVPFMGEARWSRVGEGYSHTCAVRDFLRHVQVLPLVGAAGLGTLSFPADYSPPS